MPPVRIDMVRRRGRGLAVPAREHVAGRGARALVRVGAVLDTPGQVSVFPTRTAVRVVPGRDGPVRGLGALTHVGPVVGRVLLERVERVGVLPRDIRGAGARVVRRPVGCVGPARGGLTPARPLRRPALTPSSRSASRGSRCRTLPLANLTTCCSSASTDLSGNSRISAGGDEVIWDCCLPGNRPRDTMSSQVRTEIIGSASARRGPPGRSPSPAGSRARSRR